MLSDVTSWFKPRPGQTHVLSDIETERVGTRLTVLHHLDFDGMSKRRAGTALHHVIGDRPTVRLLLPVQT